MNNASSYPFSTIIPVRITDINYGNHLGHAETVGIFHHARVLFLNKHDFDEMNIDGYGVILLNSQYSFKTEAKFNNQLLINVGVSEFSKLKFSFSYQALNNETGDIISDGNEEFVLYDYTKRKIAKMPEDFLIFCLNNQINKSTSQAMEELEAGKGKRFDNLDAFMENLNDDD